MTNFSAFPDSEAIVGDALRAAGITDLDERVYSVLPPKCVFPAATVQRIGGLPAVRRVLDAARIQIDVWGGTKSEARDIAAAARLILMDLEGEHFPDYEGFVTGVEDDLGLAYLPDNDTGRDRYIFGVVIYARAATGSS